MVKQSKIDEGLRKFLLLGKVELEQQRTCKGERFLMQQGCRALNRVLAVLVFVASWEVIRESCSLWGISEVLGRV